MITAQIGFALLTLVCAALVTNIFFQRHPDQARRSKYRKLFLSALFVWALVLSILSLSGSLSNFSSIPPPMTVVLVVPMAVFVLLMFNRSFSGYLQSIASWKIILLQSFRVPVELLLYHQYKEGITPVQMTFEGGNLDILTGLLAPFAAYLVYKKPRYFRHAGMLFNIIGLVLLVNIVTTAVLSFPGPFRHS